VAGLSRRTYPPEVDDVCRVEVQADAADYLAIERKAEFRSEFFKGENVSRWRGQS